MFGDFFYFQKMPASDALPFLLAVEGIRHGDELKETLSVVFNLIPVIGTFGDTTTIVVQRN